MKKIIISLFLLASINAVAQDSNDSTYIKSLPLQARLVAYLTPYVHSNIYNDSLFTVFIKWRAAQRANFVTGVTTITIDSIPTVELAGMYNYVLNGWDGMSVVSVMKPELAAARAAHSYLDRLCTYYENACAQRLSQLITNGYLLQRGH